MSTEENKILNSHDLIEKENEKLCKWSIEHESEESITEETHRTKIRRDRDRILYTGGFRRLQDKTQVLAAVKHGDHRTRLTHTLEVEQIALSIADALSLNKDLVSAIALGHDVGHTPFGHAVERELNKKLSKEGGFSHAVQSVRYLQGQAFDGKGAHLSFEVLEGILMHDTDVYAEDFKLDCENLEEDDDKLICEKLDTNTPGSLEAQVVYWSDKIAYLTHDFEDFIKQGIMATAIKENENLKYEIKIVLTALLEEDKCKKIVEGLRNYKTRDLVRNIINQLLEGSKVNLDNIGGKPKDIDYPQHVKDQTLENIKEKEKESEENIKKYKNKVHNLIELKANGKIEKKIEKNIYEIKEAQKVLIKEINKLELIKEKDDSLKCNEMKEVYKEYVKQKNKVKELKDEEKLLSEIKNNDISKKEEGEIIVEIRRKKIKKKSYQEGLIINFTDDYRSKYLTMRDLLDEHYIGSPTVMRSDAKAVRIVEFLFKEFTKNTKVMPLNIQKQIKDDGTNKNRVVADYIASMTDRYASETYHSFNALDNEYNY